MYHFQYITTLFYQCYFHYFSDLFNKPSDALLSQTHDLAICELPIDSESTELDPIINPITIPSNTMVTVPNKTIVTVQIVKQTV